MNYKQKAYEWGCRSRLEKRPIWLNPFVKGDGEYEAFDKGRRGLCSHREGRAETALAGEAVGVTG